MRLLLWEGAFAVCRLGPDDPDPAPAPSGCAFWSLTLVAGERSLICDETAAPEAATVVTGWRLLQVEGPLDLGLTGVMAGIAAPLGDAGVPVFPIATHDTDWLFVPGAQLELAVAALRDAGHEIVG